MVEHKAARRQLKTAIAFAVCRTRRAVTFKRRRRVTPNPSTVSATVITHALQRYRMITPGAPGAPGPLLIWWAHAHGLETFDACAAPCPAVDVSLSDVTAPTRLACEVAFEPGGPGRVA